MQQEFAGLDESWPYGMGSDCWPIIHAMIGQGSGDDQFRQSHPDVVVPSSLSYSVMENSWLQPTATGSNVYGSANYMDIRRGGPV